MTYLPRRGPKPQDHVVTALQLEEARRRADEDRRRAEETFRRSEEAAVPPAFRTDGPDPLVELRNKVAALELRVAELERRQAMEDVRS